MNIVITLYPPIRVIQGYWIGQNRRFIQAPLPKTPPQVIGIVGPQGEKGDDGAGEIQIYTGHNTGTVDFTLSKIPDDAARVRMYVNGQRFFPGESFSVSGAVVHWNSEFLISDSDRIEFSF